MARGDAKAATAFIEAALSGDYNLTSDTISWSLVTNTFASIDANSATLDMGDVTVVASAGSYAAGTTLASAVLSKSGANVMFDGADFSIAANPSNPITARCIVYYDNTSASDDIICIADLTSDGTTAVDLTSGVNITLNANGLLYGTVNA